MRNRQALFAAKPFAGMKADDQCKKQHGKGRGTSRDFSLSVLSAFKRRSVADHLPVFFSFFSTSDNQ
jgi:hypothetical protein